MPKGEHRRGQPPRPHAPLTPERREALCALADEFVTAIKSGQLPIPQRLLDDLAVAREVDVTLMDETRAQGDLPVTDREAQALGALSHGLTRSEAGATLGIGEQTIATLTLTARRKLKAKNTTHAVALALRRGLIY